MYVIIQLGSCILKEKLCKMLIGLSDELLLNDFLSDSFDNRILVTLRRYMTYCRD